MNAPSSVQTEPLLSDARVRDVLQRELRAAIIVERRFTREQLEKASGVNVHTIDALRSADPAKQRRVTMADAFSLAFVLGERAVNALLALIGYGGAAPLDGQDTFNPVAATANAMGHLAVIARAAADGRIDHIEEPECQLAADALIAEVLPLSSAGRSHT